MTFEPDIECIRQIIGMRPAASVEHFQNGVGWERITLLASGALMIQVGSESVSISAEATSKLVKMIQAGSTQA